MDSSIENLKSTTFSGRRFTRKQIVQIQDTVKAFPFLSRRELAHTICEHFQWVTPNGRNKVQTCLNVLEELEKLSIITLPKKAEHQKRGSQRKIAWSSDTEKQPVLEGALDEFMPVTLEAVTEKNQITQWNEYVDRHHYLGYRRPIGPHIRYYLLDKNGNRLGCLMFSYASKSLPCRDQWIGWDDRARQQRLDLVINNNRFLIFPWVKINSLASKALSMACKKLPGDWETYHGYRPVLLETYVDPTKYTGTCYRAANWNCIGKTAGKKASANNEEKSPKDIYVYPLSRNFKSQLINGKQTTSSKKNKIFRADQQKLDIDDPFVLLWRHIISTVISVADDFDRQWQKRKRVLNTLLLILFIFRLVFSKNKQGYAITIGELWNQCHAMNVSLPQPQPVAPSAFCNARAKLDEGIFKTLNTEIIRAYETPRGDHLWKEHKIFAVDGTKVNLPRQLTKKGYKAPSDQAYYPQGLVSCLYQLKSKIPVDFELKAHPDERALALTHLEALSPNDVVVYDRGYFSYAMLYYHIKKGIHPVFRIPNETFTVINKFNSGNETDQIVNIIPEQSTSYKIKSKHPDIEIIPLRFRLIKYRISETTYILGTTLFDIKQYKTEEFKDIYHSRWGIEELYKVSKELIEVDDFHGQSERGVKQELYAHFVLVTLSRIFANHSEDNLNLEENNKDNRKIQVNMKNCLVTMARHLEALFVQQAITVKNAINTIIGSISTCRQKIRPNRSYQRRSRKPGKKWQSSGSKQPATVSAG